MQQVIITKENGVTLTETKTVGIDLAKIISAKADGSDAEIVYDIGAGDRRIKPKVWTVLNTSATITTLMSTDATSVTAYDSDGNTYTLVLHDSYIVSASEAKIEVKGTMTAVRKLEYKEGAFMTKVVYVSDALATLATAAVTTTTTAAATTTTTPAATTTTTPAATTTTTPAATTTTTPVGTTTTTT